MNKRMKNKQTKISKQIEAAVSKAFTESFASVLHDITYRIDNLMNVGLMRAGFDSKITSEMLSLATPILDGFVISDNSPVAGSIAWTDCNVMYKGTKYIITNGNTPLKYLYWQLGTTPTTFKFSATKPVLTDDDILIAINNAGTHQMVIGEGRMVDGAILLDGTISSGELGVGAVTTTKIANLAITTGLMADDAVTSAKIGTGAVDSTALGANAVISGKIATDAVAATNIVAGAVTDVKLADDAVTSAKIATGAVDATAIGANAVIAGKIATDAVASANIAAGAVIDTKLGTGAVTSTKIAADAVTSAAIATGAVGSTELGANAVINGKIATGAVATAALADAAVTTAKIGAGQVATDKLSIATHLLF